MAGGAVVVKKSRIIQAELPGTITRDEAFTLLIEGKFTKEDGTIMPFRIKEKYDISRDKKRILGGFCEWLLRIFSTTLTRPPVRPNGHPAPSTIKLPAIH